MHTIARLGDTVATVAMTAPTAGTVQAWRQWIGRPMAAGNAFTTSTTFKAYLQVLESAIDDNLFARCNIRILSEDGTVVRATLKTVADYSTAAEFNTALRNKAYLDGDASVANYTTVDGDRLVFEFGAADAAGTTILGSVRVGSTAAAIADLAENETGTSTAERGWFETSLNITFKTPLVVDRYLLLDGTNTAGGNGTTNTNSGANRAWVAMGTALAALAARDWPTNNEQPTLHCSGTVADAPAGSLLTGTIHTAPDCYLSILCDSPTSLIYSTSYYRIEPAIGVAGFTNTGVLYLRIVGYQTTGNPPSSAGGYSACNFASVATPEPGDIRIDRVRINYVQNPLSTGNPSGMATSTAAPNVVCTITNSVAVNVKSSGSTSSAWRKSSGATVNLAFYNCVAYNCGIGFHSVTNDVLAKNCGAVSCGDGFNSTFAAASTNNASDLALDAPGSNARNSVTPTFVSAGTDFHLTSSDTAWKDFGADLSADARLPFATDGDGVVRTGTWDIGAHEFVATAVLVRSFVSIVG